MPEDKLLNVGELVNGEISSEGCLFSFFSYYSNPNICLLNHSHIISSISDRTGSFLSKGFN